jgi:hypothetical protein
MTDSFAMDRIEIQRKLYDARNEYLKAKKSMEFWKREISFLNTPLAEEFYGG